MSLYPLRGFSVQNIWRMRAFYLAWTDETQILQQPVGEITGAPQILKQPVKKSKKAKLSQPATEFRKTKLAQPVRELKNSNLLQPVTELKSENLL